MWKDYYLDHKPRIDAQVARKQRALVAVTATATTVAVTAVRTLTYRACKEKNS